MSCVGCDVLYGSGGTCSYISYIILFYCSVQVLTIKQYHSTVEMVIPRNHDARSIKQTTVGSFWMIDSVRVNYFNFSSKDRPIPI